MAVPVWSPYTFANVIAMPITELLRYGADTQTSGAEAQKREQTINEMLAGFGDFGQALHRYLSQTSGVPIQQLGNLDVGNIFRAYDRAGAILRGWDPNWVARTVQLPQVLGSGPASGVNIPEMVEMLEPDARPQQAAAPAPKPPDTKQLAEQYRNELRSQKLDPNWLSPADRKKYNDMRWWHGPNSMFGRFKGNEKAFNEWAWKTFGNKPEVKQRLDALVQERTNAALQEWQKNNPIPQQQQQMTPKQMQRAKPINEARPQQMTPSQMQRAKPINEAQPQQMTADQARQLENAFLQQMQQASDTFKRSIMEALPQALRGYEGQYKAVMEGLEGMGQTAKRETAKRFYKVGQSDTAGLAARGLSGTTVGSALATQRAREESDAQAAIDEQVRAEKTAAMERIGDKFIGSLNDILARADEQSRMLGMAAIDQFNAGVQNRIGNAWDFMNAMAGIRSMLVPPYQAPPSAGDYIGRAITGSLAAWGEGRSRRDALEEARRARRASLFGSALSAAGDIGGAALGGWLGRVPKQPATNTVTKAATG